MIDSVNSIPSKNNPVLAELRTLATFIITITSADSNRGSNSTNATFISLIV